MIPEENPAIITGKVFYLIVLLFSYPLIVYVANQVLEFYIFRKMAYSELRKWLKNLSRLTNCTIAAIIAVTFYMHLHQINSTVGVILGSIVVIIVPSLIHNKLAAETRGERVLNYSLVGYAVIAATVITIMNIYQFFFKHKSE